MAVDSEQSMHAHWLANLKTNPYHFLLDTALYGKSTHTQGASL